MIWKGRLVFLGPTDPARGQGGWTEIYFGESASYNDAATALNAIAVARVAMLCPDCRFLGGDVSDTTVLRDSYPIALAPVAGGYAPSGAPMTYNQDIALRSNWSAGPGHRSKRFIRCVPEDCVNVLGHKSLAATWDTKLTDYYGAVETNAKLASVIKSPAPGGPYYTLFTYTVVEDGELESRDLGRPFSLRRGRARIA